MSKYSSPLLDRNCAKCLFYNEEWEGEYGGYLSEVSCEKHPTYANLKSFPFKKKMSCFRLDFWHSKFAELIDGTEESYDKAVDLWKRSH